MPVLFSLLLALLWGQPAAPPIGERYAAYWLLRENQPAHDRYIKLLVTRFPLPALPRGLYGTDRPLLDTSALLLDTYDRDSIWNKDWKPFKPVTQAANLNEAARSIQINSTTYRYEVCPLKDVIRLLEKPEGTIPIHRLHAPLSGMEQTAKSLLLLLKKASVTDEQRRAKFGPNGEQRLGGWRAWIEMHRISSLLDHAQESRQIVYRQGPQEAAPVKLFELTSTGGVRILLREDGTLLVQGVGTPPALFFPNTAKGITLKLPPPKTWDDKHFGPSPSLGETIVWLDDLLFYGREVYPARYMIGYLRVDGTKKQIVENRLCIEVTNPKQEAYAWATSIAPIPPVRIGDYIFWRNRGTPNKYDPKGVQGIWKESQMRVFHLKTHQLLPLNQVPAEILRANQEKLTAMQMKNI